MIETSYIHHQEGVEGGAVVIYPAQLNCIYLLPEVGIRKRASLTSARSDCTHGVFFKLVHLNLFNFSYIINIVNASHTSVRVSISKQHF